MSLRMRLPIHEVICRFGDGSDQLTNRGYNTREGEPSDMNRSEIAISVIARVTGVSQASLAPEMELVADLGVDSARALELIVELEDRLSIEIDDDDAAGMNTVGDVLATIASLGPSPDQSRESR